MAEFSKDVLVTTDWVEKHKQDPDVRLVEVDVDTSSYDTGHIEGALGWNWSTQLNDQVRRDILSRGQMEELLGQSGIQQNTLIVLYGDNYNWFAAYAYWQLKLFGHEKVKLMNGGRKKWELEGRAFTKDIPAVPAVAYRGAKPNLNLRAHQPEVLSAINDESVVLVDVRSPQEFSGQVIAPPGMTETAQRGGHIPHARNIPWSKAVNEDGTFKSSDALADLYSAVGVTPDKNVITYCRIGERSAHSWFVLRELLGFTDVKNYDGSWTEWGSMIGTPIEK